MAEQQPPIRTGLLDFFRKSSGCQFVIPVYQRNYTWTAGKEVAQYMTDLESVLRGEYSNHFLGILIYLDTPIDSFTREYSVIDGQQRLTTTFIILYAIRAILKKQGASEQVSNLDGQYLTNPFASEKIKYKLKPLVSDDEVYRKIVEEKEDKIGDTESNVYKNYIYVSNRINELMAAGFSADSILTALNKLYVVCVPISEEDNAQKIFESINATGVKLTASDLIRNYILMGLQSDTQEKYYANYWKSIEDYISGDAKKLELFFRMYLAVRTHNLVNKNAIYDSFVKWTQENNLETEDLLRDIVRYAEAYYCVYRKPVQELDIGIRESIKEFRRILSDMPAPALMELYLLYNDNAISEKAFAELVTLINNYLIRRALCNLDTSSITRMFPTFIREVMEECDGNYDSIVDISAKKLVTKNIGNAMYMPTDSQMREVVNTANMYNIRSTLRLFLDKLEHHNNSAPVDLAALSVEHIMPQSMSKDWMKELQVDEETYNNNLNRLGNLTLASKSDNSAMGNGLWSYKNAILKSTSHLKINESLLKVDKWTIEEIDKRTAELIDKMIELFPYPEVSEDIIAREEIILDFQNSMAVGYLSMEDGSVEVDVGSVLQKREDLAKYQYIEDLRQELMDEGYVAEVDGVMQFVKPYTFYSSGRHDTALSLSASVLLHGAKNGWYYWKDKSGRALNDVLELKAHFTGSDEKTP